MVTDNILVNLKVALYVRTVSHGVHLQWCCITWRIYRSFNSAWVKFVLEYCSISINSDGHTSQAQKFPKNFGCHRVTEGPSERVPWSKKFLERPCGPTTCFGTRCMIFFSDVTLSPTDRPNGYIRTGLSHLKPASELIKILQYVHPGPPFHWSKAHVHCLLKMATYNDPLL